jgi:hypothetical protein
MLRLISLICTLSFLLFSGTASVWGTPLSEGKATIIYKQNTHKTGFDSLSVKILPDKLITTEKDKVITLNNTLLVVPGSMNFQPLSDNTYIWTSNVVYVTLNYEKAEPRDVSYATVEEAFEQEGDAIPDVKSVKLFDAKGNTIEYFFATPYFVTVWAKKIDGVLQTKYLAKEQLNQKNRVRTELTVFSGPGPYETCDTTKKGVVLYYNKPNEYMYCGRVTGLP